MQGYDRGSGALAPLPATTDQRLPCRRGEQFRLNGVRDNSAVPREDAGIDRAGKVAAEGETNASVTNASVTNASVTNAMCRHAHPRPGSAPAGAER